jgi:hypothetical protein
MKLTLFLNISNISLFISFIWYLASTSTNVTRHLKKQELFNKEIIIKLNNSRKEDDTCVQYPLFVLFFFQFLKCTRSTRYICCIIHYSLSNNYTKISKLTSGYFGSTFCFNGMYFQ